MAVIWASRHKRTAKAAVAVFPCFILTQSQKTKHKKVVLAQTYVTMKKPLGGDTNAARWR